jgi:hypothetical protein
VSNISQGAQLKWAITALIGGQVDLRKYGISASAAYEAWLIFMQMPEWDLYNSRANAYHDLFGSLTTPNGKMYDEVGRDAHHAFIMALTS